MYEIIFYGRGGQGAVTAAQIVAEAAFLKGLHAQAFPKFGIERRGAPVNAFARISENPIEYRGSIREGDYAIVTDVMSIPSIMLFKSIKQSGSVILNSPLPIAELNAFKERLDRDDVKIFSVDATEISAEVFGETSIPLTSVAMVGAFSAVSGLIELSGIKESLGNLFEHSLAEKNFESALMAYQRVRR